jgi:hypothetical protein
MFPIHDKTKTFSEQKTRREREREEDTRLSEGWGKVGNRQRKKGERGREGGRETE